MMIGNVVCIDLGELSFLEGGHLLVKSALKKMDIGDVLKVEGTDQRLDLHLSLFCRQQGHMYENSKIEKKRISDPRRNGAMETGKTDYICEEASQEWGLAPRSAMVEKGGPAFNFKLNQKNLIWAEEAGRLYRQACSAQWDPETAINWKATCSHSEEIEDAVVQIMTYLVENETAALIIPSKFAGQVHPHFREVQQLLAIQAADEARHIEVMRRRALLNRDQFALTTVGGLISLKTLIDEPDFALSSFMLSVLGEGSFLNLLWFIRDYAPDSITREVATLTAQDEARHVAFGMAHLTRHMAADPSLKDRLKHAVYQRHDVLRETAGLNSEVFDALLLLAAGDMQPESLLKGSKAVKALEKEMDTGRKKRLIKIGFSEEEATELSSLHTKNFM